MPIFEFVCRGCGQQFEDLMSFVQMEAGEASCPECGSKKVERSMSSFATGSSSGVGSAPPCGGGGCGGGGAFT